MAAPVGPKKVHRYTLEFKIQAPPCRDDPCQGKTIRSRARKTNA